MTTQVTDARTRRRLALRLEIAATSVALLGVGLLAAHPLSSPDTFWHLKLGEIIAERGSIPRTDMFSAVHPEQPWIQFAWLWELLAHAIVARAGLHGLRIAQAILMIASFGVLYVCVRRASGSAAKAAFAAAAGLALFVDRFQARPDACNLLLASLAAALVLDFRRMRARGFVLLALLALVWVNLHAGTSLLLGSVLVCVQLGAALNRALGFGPELAPDAARAALRNATLCLLLFFAALISTPNALRAIAHFTSALGPIAAAHEPEWSPSLVLLGYGNHPAYYLGAFAPFAIAAAYLLDLRARYRSAGKRGLDLAEIVPCLALLALAALVTRNLFAALLSLCVLLLRAPSGPGIRRVLAASAVAIYALVFDLAGRDAYGDLARAQIAFAHDLAPGVYPEHAAAFMRRAGIRGKILNFPRWGDYLIERLYPACHVFFDSRRDVSNDMLELLSQVSRPDQRSSALERGFERYGTELVVYEAPVFAEYRPEAPWLLLYKAGPEEVYQHARGPNARENMARAHREMARAQIELPEDPADARSIDAVTRAGSVAWLSDAWQTNLLVEQKAALASQAPGERQRGARTTGLLLFRAGAYAPAAALLEPVVAADPKDASARYHLAFALLLSGQRDAAYTLARAASPALLAALNPAQRYRFAKLRADASAAH